ncbi:MAG: PH domain-containing protein [Candidatus Dormibacteria bacterium]
MNLSHPGVWHRVHPLSPLVRVGRRAVGLLVVLLFPYVSGKRSNEVDLLIDVGILVLVLIAGFVYWWVTRWRVADGMVQIDTGLIRRQRSRVPLSRMQSVDVVRPGAARILGLAEVRVRTASGPSSDARLAYVRGPEAERIRDYLLQIARGQSAPSEVVEAPLARIDDGRLIVAQLLRGRTAVILVVVVALVVVGTQLGGAHGGRALVAAGVATGVGGVVATLRQLNSMMGYRVAEASDGLHVRGGLVSTVLETIPRHRIQALRVSEPLLWRLPGWAALSLDVAGGQRRRGEDRAAAGQLRALLPVASRAEVESLLANLEPKALGAVGDRPPRRAQIKSPLSYHFLRGGVGEGLAGASGGRVQRTITWVPLAKVQSVRWVQGPVQRRLGLATVNLDIAGHKVGVALRDRSLAEAVGLAERLPGLCRQARADARSNPAPAAPLPPAE